MNKKIAKIFKTFKLMRQIYTEREKAGVVGSTYCFIRNDDSGELLVYFRDHKTFNMILNALPDEIKRYL